MGTIQHITLTALIAYFKNTPAILGIFINTVLSIILVILARLKQWLKTTKRTIIFSLLFSFVATFTTFALYKASNLLPSDLYAGFIYFSALFLIINFVTFLSINLTADKTAMGKHESAIDADIKDPSFRDRLKRVTEALSLNLRDIDFQTNWSILNFVPLDAEVELIRDGKGRQKRVTDLLKAIKPSTAERLFLVIGDPGSGKSVALRKLCQDLAKEVAKTGKIPVYINLKEWQQKWERGEAPTVEQLNDFVLNSLKKRDIVTTDFFNKYYSSLYEQGRLYFVLDSFDEIPSVLGEYENSILIRQLSSVMHNFLRGARQQSQGILASRVFRRPTEKFKTSTVLEIRPFSETKINETFYKTLGYGKDVVKDLFKNRFDLLDSASNPFTASLLASYARDHQDNLPDNMMSLYESYFDNALNNSEQVIKDNKISKEQVQETSLGIANLMFMHYGFEVHISALKEKLAPFQKLVVDEVTDVLQFARIGRRSRETGLFSFSHRRFCEFFVVKQLVLGAEDLHLDDIPKDSQWRDALVMYCQVASESQAVAIAEYCWGIIRTRDNSFDQEYIHCMRFLRDAFKTRTSAIAPFRNEFAKHIRAQIDRGSNVILSKLAVECLGLIDNKNVDRGASSAMASNNVWLIETAIKACRTLPNASKELQKNIKRHITNRPIDKSLIVSDDLMFSLSLSPSMKAAKTTYINSVIDNWLLVLVLLFDIARVTNAPDKSHTGYVIINIYLMSFYFFSEKYVVKRFGFLWRNMIWITASLLLYSLIGKTNASGYSLVIPAVLLLIHFYLVSPSLNVIRLLRFVLLSIVRNPKSFIKGVFLLVSASALVFGLVYMLITYLNPFIQKVIGSVVGIGIFSFVIVYSALRLRRSYRNYKRIVKHRCNDRSYINRVINMFCFDTIVDENKGAITSDVIADSPSIGPIQSYYLSKFITYLEVNVQ